MRNFSTIIAEMGRKPVVTESNDILRDEITRFISKVNRKMPALVKKAAYMTQKWNITSRAVLDKIRTSNKGALSRLVDTVDMPLDDLVDLWSLLRQIGGDYKMLPQYMSDTERNAIEKGVLAMNDLTIDLTSSAGRNAAAKMYMPLVYKIVNQYVGKSRLDRTSLISAALLAMTNAMNDWQRGTKDTKDKSVPFKTYLGYRVKQQILNDINRYGHTLSGTHSMVDKNKYGAALLDAVSIDGMPRDTEGNISQDHLKAMGTTEPDKPYGKEGSLWDKIFKIISSKFSQRDTDVFYRFFGLNGRKREKSKDIAKSYGMSEGNIRNSIINKMLKFLKTNDLAANVLADLQDLYTESLMVSMVGVTDREEIMDGLLGDDTFMFLEDLNMWRSPDKFRRMLDAAVLSCPTKGNIMDLLGGDFMNLDNDYKKNKSEYKKFLSIMYPTVRINKLSDVDILELMKEIQDNYHRLK